MTKLLAHDGAGRAQEVDVTVLGGRGVAVVDFGAGKTDASVVVSAPGVTAQSVVTAQLAAIATPDHSVDEHRVEGIAVHAGAPVAGVGFTLYARTETLEIFGRWSIAWLWG